MQGRFPGAWASGGTLKGQEKSWATAKKKFLEDSPCDGSSKGKGFEPGGMVKTAPHAGRQRGVGASHVEAGFSWNAEAEQGQRDAAGVA